MQLWDGFSTDSQANVMILAATNRPWELDEAVLRRLGAIPSIFALLAREVFNHQILGLPNYSPDGVAFPFSLSSQVMWYFSSLCMTS